MNRLQKRAQEADVLLASIHRSLSLARASQAAATSFRQQEDQLRQENERLRNEVRELKRRLVALETRNGAKQVPLPNQSQRASSGAAAEKEKKNARNSQQDEGFVEQASEEAEPGQAFKFGEGESQNRYRSLSTCMLAVIQPTFQMFLACCHSTNTFQTFSSVSSLIYHPYNFL